jgi:2,3-bisphosphoglycerate-dependent phosphoglycerate mutase
MKKTKLILMRHGQSTWNLLNLFTGWVDVPLSEKGVKEAIDGGMEIAHLPIDVMFTSTLVRAQMTAMLAMIHHHGGKSPVLIHPKGTKELAWGKSYHPDFASRSIPCYTAWELNERMYGELQGLNKDETRKKFGEEQVHIWRRSYDVAPPGGESLKDTAARTLPYFNERILPVLAEGKSVFVAAHGNSLRSIVMQIDGLSEDEVLKLEIPTGKPMIYEYSSGELTQTASGIKNKT